jgi:hypothetical protein
MEKGTNQYIKRKKYVSNEKSSKEKAQNQSHRLFERRKNL